MAFKDQNAENGEFQSRPAVADPVDYFSMEAVGSSGASILQ